MGCCSSKEDPSEILPARVSYAYTNPNPPPSIPKQSSHTSASYVGWSSTPASTLSSRQQSEHSQPTRNQHTSASSLGNSPPKPVSSPTASVTQTKPTQQKRHVSTDLAVARVNNPSPLLQAAPRQQQRYSSTDLPVTRVDASTQLQRAAPRCRCGTLGVRETALDSNLNGNEGRPYFHCPSCGKFLTFADKRGLDPANPPCDCGAPSRRLRAGVNAQNPGGVFYKCQSGACGFYDEEVDRYGRQEVIPDSQVKAYAARGYI